MMYPSISQVLGSLLVLLTLRRVYLFYFGPLAKLPGPTVSRFTSARFITAIFAGRQIFYIQNLHDEYGPIVRVSPSHVAIADPELVHQIHKNHAQYPKSRFYTDFTSGIENTFSMRDIKKHAERRRLLGSQMTESALKTLEPLVSEKVEKAVAKMRSEAEANSGVVDVQKWSYCMSGDILGQLSFNEDFGLLEAGKKTPFLKAVEEINMRALPAACFPSLNGWLGKIPGFRGPKGAVSEVLSHARRVLRQYAAMTDADPQAASRQPTFFSKFLGAQSDGTLTEQQVIEEANNAIIAGTDTTAITLSYMIWLIAQDADLQEQLATDLENVPLTNQKLKAVPLVEHILDETLRLYGAAPGMLPRDVPEQGTQMGDYFIPQDMTVITQPWTMHRNEDIFDEADEFLPYRWEAPTPAMRDSFMPFGGGVRACLGQNLARTELRLALAHFFKTFPEISIAEHAAPDAMAIVNYFVIMPKGHKNLIQVGKAT